jgi:hypothetical protein
MSAYRIIVACLLVGALSGCTSSDELQKRFQYRWGPDPAMPASDVQTAIGDELQVLSYITNNAPLDATSPDDVWFEVAEWGFNVGRRDCQIYMDYMFRLNREKARDDGMIAGLSAASAAIVGVTTKSPAKALSVLAASFGLATALNDAIFQSYLFSEAPGLISIKVGQLQDTYQQQVEKVQAEVAPGTHKLVTTTTMSSKLASKSAPAGSPSGASQDTTTTVVKPITTPAQAFSAIQTYYNICLPQSIEGVLLQAVADTKATPSSPSNSSSPTLKSAKSN